MHLLFVSNRDGIIQKKFNIMEAMGAKEGPRFVNGAPGRV
ncbi:hypothetical protein SRB521_01179 [Intestinimonas butyriciproducens]|nr:hypothetical protein SRB521_01179 [Intestinimonas butyriciproducens]